MPPGPHVLVMLHGGPDDPSGLAMKADDRGHPPMTRFPFALPGHEPASYVLGPQPDSYGQWHAHMELT